MKILEHKLADDNKHVALFGNVERSILLAFPFFAFFFANGKIDIALSWNDGLSLSCPKVTYIRYCETASASVQISPCTSLCRMIIIYVELDRGLERMDAIGREWFHIIMKPDGSLYTVYALKLTTQQRDDRCIALLCNTRHLHHTCSHYRALFCNPAICPSPASYN